MPCIDALGETHRLRLSAHAPGPLQKTRIDHPESAALRELFTSKLAAEAGLTWHEVGQARCWLVPAQAMYDQIRALMRHGITIYTPSAEIKGIATLESTR